MNRRLFLEILPAGTLSVLLCPSVVFSNPAMRTKTEQIIFKVTKSAKLSLPENKKISFGWSAVAIEPDSSIVINTTKKLPHTNLWLRISVAQEVWDKKIIHARIPDTGIEVGTILIQYSSILVPYEMEIPERYIDQINANGLELFLESKSPLWIFNERHPGIEHDTFLPHILSSTTKQGTLNNMLENILSINSIQSFGWREGTVLDGLWQIYSCKKDHKALKTIKQHFDLFFDKHQNLIYNTAKDVTKFNQINGIESTIPFATLAHLHPDHPILKTVIEAWKEYSKPNGMVTDGKMISAEGCYTVAYPMAVIGKAWKDEALMKNALEQLRHRFVLIDSGQFYLRSTEGKLSFRNWARGVAWVLLGFIRTITELKNDVQDQSIISKYQEGVAIALSMQRKDGLWGCFMHNPDSLPDSSGSAGIAAAILSGIKHGYLPESNREAVMKCWNRLPEYLTPDGFLKGAAQDNRGGISLQESDYRVIAQVGMGFMAQLYAEI